MIDPRVRDLLRERAGIVVETLGEGAVLSSIERRARARELSVPDYLARLPDDPREGAELVEDVLVPETWFYRDLAPFALLTELAAQRRWPGPVRALSFPCSSGEEAYSIVIALLAGGLAAHEVSVEGWDLSARALDRARAALYTPFSLRGTPAWLREQHLHAEGTGFRVDPAISGRAQFKKANILDLDPRGGHAFDVILCRNLFIYLERPARERALLALAAALSPAGVLVLGHADGWPEPSAGLRPVGPPGAFAFERLTPHPLSAPAERGSRARSGASGAFARGASPGASMQTAVARTSIQPGRAAAMSPGASIHTGQPAAISSGASIHTGQPAVVPSGTSTHTGQPTTVPSGASTHTGQPTTMLTGASLQPERPAVGLPGASRPTATTGASLQRRPPTEAARRAPPAPSPTAPSPPTAPAASPLPRPGEGPGVRPLDEARALADRGELREARARCEACVARAPLSPDGHRLLGVILVALGDLRGADASLRRALYLDPQDAEAMGHLVALSERLGLPDQAASFRRRRAALVGEK